MIELQNISVRFHQKDKVIQAVEDVDLFIEKGDVYGIVGYSGAGKEYVGPSDESVTKTYRGKSHYQSN